MRRFLRFDRRRHRWLLILPILLAACDMAAAPPPGTSTPPAAVPAPASTPLPSADLLARALRLRSAGEYDLAAVELHALLTAHPDAPEARAARFYLAESFALRGRWTSAVEALRAFVAGGPQDDLYARALFLIARGHEQAGSWAEAVAAYERYRALGTLLEPYARLRQAAQEQALGRLEPAAASLEAAAATDIARGERAGALEKAIALRRQLGQHAAALELYRKLLDLAELPEHRARLLSEAADLAAALGAVDEARAYLREIAEQNPETPQALAAAERLLSDPQGELAPDVAARVYSAHERWDAALPQFDAAIAAATGEEALELRRQRGLARRGMGDMAGALAELAAVAAEAPDSEPGRQARLDAVQTTGQSGDLPGAIEGYRQFAQTYPDDPLAPEALARVAILLGRLGDAEAQARQQLDLGQRYPASEQAHELLYQAGWHFFQAGRPAEARAAWEILGQGASGVVAAQGAFWAARAARQAGDEPAARVLLERAAAAAPDSYYGVRAAEELGRPFEGSVPIGAPIDEPAWRAVEEWIASWSNQPAYHVGERGVPPEVAQTGPLARAIALHDYGLHVEAIGEGNEARRIWRDDPVRLYLLARLAHEHGIPYIAIKTAMDLAERAPEKSFAGAPQALRRLLYPTPYSEIVIERAREYQLDPRALYAMLRQESLFNPGALSVAGARGLAQVMPATAQGIAQNLQFPDFQEADLNRPAVSVRFGAFYLSRQLALMEGSLHGALAAYNGGPGNAQRWAGGTTVADPDLFTEGIDYTESRSYVKLVYGSYGAYRRIYAWP